MSRLLFLLSLLAVLFGPLLRTTEGADDLTRSLTELTGRHLVEEPDHGVGDDSGAAVLSIRACFQEAAVSKHRPLPASAFLILPKAGSSSLSFSPGTSLDWRSFPSESQGVPARLAWLQRFQI